MAFLSRTKQLAKKLLGRPSAVSADNRGRRMVAAIHCILNQNARDEGAAIYPAMNRRIVELCMEHDIGIVQLPCPEMRVLGLKRSRKGGQAIGIRDAMDTPEGRSCCREISIDVADCLQQYLQSGYQVLAVLGGNPKSPGCAIHTEVTEDGRQSLTSESGVFIKELSEELSRRTIEIPFKAVRDAEATGLEEDIKAFEELILADEPHSPRRGEHT